MRVKVVLHGNLRSIYTDLEEEIFLNVEGDESVADILEELGISPAVVPVVLIDGEKKDDEFLLKNDKLEEGMEIQLLGPVAGG